MHGHGFGYGDEMIGSVGGSLLRRRRRFDSRRGEDDGLVILSICVIYDFRFYCCHYYCRRCWSCYWWSFRSRMKARNPMYRQTTSGATVVVPRVRRCVFDFGFDFDSECGYDLMDA